MYIMNGISTYEYNYDAKETKVLMNKLGVKTIPTLCVIHVNTGSATPEEMNTNDFTIESTMDSHEIETNWDRPIQSFSLQEDF